MERVVLGLDIGGANLKAATSAGRAMSVPFAVWKHPDKLGAELRKLIRQFPEASAIAATMTAELCDCYETKREGVRRIVDDLVAATSLPVRFWSTEGKFVTPKAAKAQHLKVAAANWHALATFAGRFVPKGDALLIDMGTTTTDLIPLKNGVPNTKGLTDTDRLHHCELLYMGWKRTPVMALISPHSFASELFATCQDASIILKLVPENASDLDTADGRPATLANSLARMARMKCGDVETMPRSRIVALARFVSTMQCLAVREHIQHLQSVHLRRWKQPIPIIVNGSGSFLIRLALDHHSLDFSNGRRFYSQVIQLDSHCSPAFAVAILL